MPCSMGLTERQQEHTGRSGFVIDKQLMIEALKVSGARTWREAVEMSLRMLLELHRQRDARRLRGKINWTGDLKAARPGPVARRWCAG